MHSCPKIICEFFFPCMCHYHNIKYHTVKTLSVKNFAEFGGELQQFAKFFANFHHLHNIPYANEFPTVLIHQSFLPPEFLLYSSRFLCWGIHSFSLCRYIRHLVKVMPRVIEVNGEPTGY